MQFVDELFHGRRGYANLLCAHGLLMLFEARKTETLRRNYLTERCSGLGGPVRQMILASALGTNSTDSRANVNFQSVTHRYQALPQPCMPRKTGAETGLTHTKRLFRVKLTPCFPVVVELARSRTGREP